MATIAAAADSIVWPREERKEYSSEASKALSSPGVAGHAAPKAGVLPIWAP